MSCDHDSTLGSHTLSADLRCVRGAYLARGSSPRSLVLVGGLDGASLTTPREIEIWTGGDLTKLGWEYHWMQAPLRNASNLST